MHAQKCAISQKMALLQRARAGVAHARSRHPSPYLQTTCARTRSNSLYQIETGVIGEAT